MQVVAAGFVLYQQRKRKHQHDDQQLVQAIQQSFSLLFRKPDTIFRNPQIRRHIKNLFAEVKEDPIRFQRMVRFTHEQFMDLHREIRHIFSTPESRLNAHRLDTLNRLFIFLVKLRGDHYLTDLEFLTGLSDTILSDDFHFILSRIIGVLAYEIQWPDEKEQSVLATLVRDHPDLHDIIGYLDATHVDIYRPSTISQRIYFRNNKRKHTLLYQVIVDWRGVVRWAEGSIPGALSNDHRFFSRSDIYQQSDNYLHHRFRLCADGGYSCTNFLVTPYAQDEIKQETKDAQENFNKMLRRHRVIVEYTFAAIKNTWRVLIGKSRFHNHRSVDQIFYLACILSNRLMRLNNKYLRGAEYLQGQEEAWAKRLRLAAEH